MATGNNVHGERIADQGRATWYGQPSRAGGHLPYLLLLLVPIGLLFVFSWAALTLGTPGFRVDKTQHGLNVSTVFKVINDIRPGDLIIALDQEPYPEVLAHLLLHPGFRPATARTITLLRNAEKITISPKTAPLTWQAFIAILWPHLLLIGLFFFLGLLALFRSAENEPGQLFYAMLCWFSCSFASTIPSHVGLLSPTIISLSFFSITLSNWIAFGSLAHFTCRFPTQRDLCRNRPWLAPLLYLAPPLVTVGLALAITGIDLTFYSQLQRFRNLFVPVVIIGCFAKHLTDSAHLISPYARNQVKLTLTAYWLTFAPYFFLYLLPNLFFDHPLISFRVIVLCSLLLPTAYLIALLRYRLLGVDRMISRTLAYFITILLFAILYTVLLALAKRLLFGPKAVREDLFLLFLLFIALTFNPIINRLQRIIDRMFFRYRSDSDNLLYTFSQKLAATLDFERLIGLICTELPRELAIGKVALVLLDRQDARFFGADLRTETTKYCIEETLPHRFHQGRRFIFCGEETNNQESTRCLTLLREQGFAVLFPLWAGEELIGMLLLGRRKDGRLFLDHEVRLLATVANQAALALKNSQHYTSLVESKKQLETLFSKMIQSEKLAALGEMSATLAHEIKNPLGIIRSSAQYLAETRRSPAMQSEILNYIIDEVDGLNRLLGNILDLARAKPPSLAPLDLHEELPRLCEQWQQASGHDGTIEMECQVDPDVPIIHGDGKQLRQVFLNLFKNSAEAMNGKGRITVRAGRIGEAVYILLLDTGTGVSPEECSQVFTKFYSTKDKGLGLGLSVCKQIVEAHQGTITLQNRKTGGAKIHMELPIHPLSALRQEQNSQG